jgi:AcrR family transcriptional regulator
MEHIAKKAGISKGLTYNYFESKNAVLDEILRKGFDAIYTHFDLNKDGILTLNEFEIFVRQSFNVINDNISFWKLYFSLMMQPVVTETYIQNYRETSSGSVDVLIRFLTENGSSNPSKDLFIISSLLKGAYLIFVTSPDSINQEDFVSNILDGIQRILHHKTIEKL